MIKEIKENLKNSEAILISGIPNVIYFTNFSGFSDIEREVFLLVTKNKNYLITDRRYSEAVEKQVADFKVIDTGAINFLINGKEFFEKEKINLLNIEENNLTVSEYKALKKYIKTKNVDLKNLRIIKNDLEIKNIKKACEIGDLAFEYILTKLKIGVTEKEISDELINFFKSKNADFSFKPIVAFGENSSAPHHENSDRKLEENQIVLLDFGVKVNNYCSDMTRTVFFGKADKKFKEIYNNVLEAQKLSIESVKLNIKASEIDKKARDYILKNNFPNIIHSVGHGIGIEVHETPHISPNSTQKIKNGMTFSVEPGIYISNYGGVRIEDLVLVRDGCAELISHSKREIIEVNV